MEVKKVKRILTIIFAALFTALIVVFPSFSAIIQSQCKCHIYTDTSFNKLVQNATDPFTIEQIFNHTLNATAIFLS